MIPRIATVITQAWWEPAFVGWARRTAAARVMARCRHPGEVDRVAGVIEAMAVGSSCPWLTAEAVGRWRQGGVRVVGVIEEGDRGGERLVALGCDTVVDEQLEALAEVLLAAGRPGPGGLRRTWVVTGPRGAPGRTEIAIGIASLLSDHHPTVLVEADVEAPSLGLRLGLAPQAGPPVPRSWEGFEVVSLSPGTTLADIDLVASGLTAEIVVDAGPSASSVRRWFPDHVMIVVEPTPTSVVRAASLIARLADLRPLVIANRAGPAEGRLVADTLEREVWTVPASDGIEWGGPPCGAIRRAMAGSVRRSDVPIDSCPGT